MPCRQTEAVPPFRLTGVGCGTPPFSCLQPLVALWPFGQKLRVLGAGLPTCILLRNQHLLAKSMLSQDSLPAFSGQAVSHLVVILPNELRVQEEPQDGFQSCLPTAEGGTEQKVVSPTFWPVK